MSVEAQTFRNALASWASGVTIVTSRHRAEIHGMTVSAFSSVSLAPPLVLVCADRSSNTHALMRSSRCFAANLLGRGQEQLALLFADKRREAERFVGIEHEPAITGAPLLRAALVSLDCTIVQDVEAGDHVIYVGQVEYSIIRPCAPLLYFQGRFGDFAPLGSRS